MNKVIEIKPRFVKVGCHRFIVKTDKKTSGKLQKLNYSGSTQYSKGKIISVDSAESSTQFHETFIHEMIHAINDTYCFNQLKEKQLTLLANGIAQALDSLNIRFVHIRRKDNEQRRTI